LRGIGVVRDQFQLLLALQQVDDRLRALALEEQQLPQRLQACEAACTAARQQLVQQQAAIEQSERQQRAFERELANHQETIRKTQSKAQEVKTNKEYSAILAEIDAGKQRLETLEDQLLALMEATDQQRQAYRLHEQQESLAQQALVEQRHQLQQEHETLRRTIAMEQERRQQMLAGLEAKLYEQYQKITAQHGGRGVAQLQEGVCSGCHLKVPPQMVSEIRLQTQVFTCPHCRLILLWPA
jgi:predicted  nucleic acid-binding Zn-ribbon protein